MFLPRWNKTIYRVKASVNVFFRLFLSYLLFFSNSLFNNALAAQARPLWELGVATGYVSIPYYRGSASSRDVVLPMPLAIYRGDENKAAKQNKQRLISPSFSLGLPVPAGGNKGVRQNMPRLNATLELGAKLEKVLWKKTNRSLSINAPLRAVTSLATRHSAMQGWVFAPYLQYKMVVKSKNAWALNAALGPQYGSAGFHQYYYGVNDSYANNTRPVYNATSGYSGSRLTVYVQKSIGRLWLSGFMRYDNLLGATFIDSPLVEIDRAILGGFVVGWVFARSPQQVWQ